MPKTFIREVTDLAHQHDIWVSTGDWAEHLLRKGPTAFKEYVEVRLVRVLTLQVVLFDRALI